MESKILVFRGEEVLLPLENRGIPDEKWISEGEVHGIGRWLEISKERPIPNGWTAVNRRALWDKDEGLFFIANRLYAEMDWRNNSRHCGRCGCLTKEGDDRGRICPACGNRTYPVISPAIIVAVEREGKILLAHNASFPGKRYSVLAGFLDLGESLEEALKREVMEEVGIEVGSIEYFGSQPWPFPRSLMVAFRAKWESGDISVDGVEIDHADWFSPGDLPEIPGGASVSRKLIDDFISRCRP